MIIVVTVKGVVWGAILLKIILKRVGGIKTPAAQAEGVPVR
jgi:hypothetical protein